MCWGLGVQTWPFYKYNFIDEITLERRMRVREHQIINLHFSRRPTTVYIFIYIHIALNWRNVYRKLVKQVLILILFTNKEKLLKFRPANASNLYRVFQKTGQDQSYKFLLILLTIKYSKNIFNCFTNKGVNMS